MKPTPTPRATSQDSRRRHRPRTTPSWLKEQEDLDEVARRRCLMVLSVLSGETPVTDAISQGGISRGLYYQLEERALRAMLRALSPNSPAHGEDSNGADGMLRRMAELEERLKKAEQDKRRMERLLFLTRKVVKPGPAKTKAGRPTSPKRASSTRRGRRPSSTSTAAASPSPAIPAAPSPGGTGVTTP